MNEDEMRSIGLATEKRLVRFQFDGKDHFEERDIWFSVEAREKARNAFFGLSDIAEAVLVE